MLPTCRSQSRSRCRQRQRQHNYTANVLNTVFRIRSLPPVPRTAKLPRGAKEEEQGSAGFRGNGFGPSPTVDAAPPARGAGRGGADARRARGHRHQRREQARPDDARHSRHRLLARQPAPRRTLRRQRPLRDPAARAGGGARSPGPGTDPRPASRPEGDHPLPLGPRQRLPAAARPAPGGDPGRLPRRRQNGGQRHGRPGRTHARRTDPRSRCAPPRPATPRISRAIQDESISSSEQGELLALPFLLLVLLLVFRSPIAAAIPLGFGAITVIASRGILYFFTSWFSIDAFALTVCTMMGLALGVDYALLMVSRFREELAAGKDPLDAARMTRRTAGRTTIFAGSTLLLSMLVSIFVVPGPAAGLAGGDGGDGRRPQRRRRHPGRAGPAGPGRPQHRSLADRRGAQRQLAADGPGRRAR